MGSSPPSASVGATQELRDHIVAPLPSAKPHCQDETEPTHPSHENTTLPQPHSEAVKETLPIESAPSKNDQTQEAPEASVAVPLLNARRDSQEAIDPSHENTSQSQTHHDEATEESAVQTGQYHSMSLDVSPSRLKISLPNSSNAR